MNTPIDTTRSQSPSVSKTGRRLPSAGSCGRLVRILIVTAFAATASGAVTDTSSPLVIDNGSAGTSKSGSWSTSSSYSPYGGKAQYARRWGSYTFSPKLAAGEYEISLYWATWSKLSSAVKVVIQTPSGKLTRTVNQRTNGSRWNLLGSYELDEASYVRILVAGSSWTCADAVKFVRKVVEPPVPVDDPPTAPVGLSAAAGDGEVVLDWTDGAEEDLVGYALYKSTTPEGTFVPVASALVESAYTDASVENGVAYYYLVTAVDEAGQESEESAVVSVTPVAPPPPPPADDPPPAPCSLAASAGNGVVSLDWADSTEGDFASYKVYRAASAVGAFTCIRTGLVQSTLTDSGLSNGLTYHYAVSAVDLAGQESPLSEEVSALPVAPPPPPPVDDPPTAPSGLGASGGNAVVTLDWADSPESDFASFKVYRASAASGPFAVIRSGLAASAFTDSGLANGSTIYYAVTAVNAAGQESLASAVVSATPTAPPPRSATLSWVAPTTNADGSALTDLAGYKVYQGTAPGQYGPAKAVGNVTSLKIDGLLSGSHYFTVTALDLAGNESAQAQEISLVLP